MEDSRQRTLKTIEKVEKIFDAEGGACNVGQYFC